MTEKYTKFTVFPGSGKPSYTLNTFEEVLADTMGRLAILINPQVFLEEPPFGLAIQNLFKQLGFPTAETSKKSNLKLFLVVTDASTNEEAQTRAIQLSEAIRSCTHGALVLDVNYFTAILAGAVPQQVVDEVIGQHFSRIGIALGSRVWIEKYMDLISWPLIGAVVEISPYSSKTYNSPSSALFAAIEAHPFPDSGTVPLSVSSRFGMRQEGHLIWAKQVDIPADFLPTLRPWRKAIAHALFSNVEGV